MDDVPICPEWWPQLLWRLHFPLGLGPHKGGGGGSPVNYPPIIDDIMANLHIHTLSYLSLDQASAKQIRVIAEKRLGEAVKSLSTLHDQSLKAER